MQLWQYCVYEQLQVCCTCFGRLLRPSSGALQTVTAATVVCHFGHGIVQCATDLEHLYRIYSILTHDKHQWLLLQFVVLLMMYAKGVRNM